jgi:hypothetical protein
VSGLEPIYTAVRSTAFLESRMRTLSTRLCTAGLFEGPNFSTALRVQELRECLLLSTELTKELILVG